MSERSIETGKKIRYFRTGKNMTLEELAAAVCKSKATLSKYEKGDIVIDIETLYEIADALEIHIDQLLVHQDKKKTDEREIDRLARQVEDRFGPLPLEVQNLLFVVKIRNLGGEMGFEKIIIKNGMQIMFFVNNPMSAYYKSKRFETILSRVNENPTLFKFNQDGGKLRTVSRGITTLSSALHILKKLQ